MSYRKYVTVSLLAAIAAIGSVACSAAPTDGTPTEGEGSAEPAPAAKEDTATPPLSPESKAAIEKFVALKAAGVSPSEMARFEAENAQYLENVSEEQLQHVAKPEMAGSICFFTSCNADGFGKLDCWFAGCGYQCSTAWGNGGSDARCGPDTRRATVSASAL